MILNMEEMKIAEETLVCGSVCVGSLKQIKGRRSSLAMARNFSRRETLQNQTSGKRGSLAISSNSSRKTKTKKIKLQLTRIPDRGLGTGVSV